MYMDWVDRLFTGRELSSLSFLAHDKGLLFKGDQVFLISPKQELFSPQERSYGNLGRVKASSDLLHAHIRVYDSSPCAAAVDHSTAHIK